jgi:hypothetical protein
MGGAARITGPPVQKTGSGRGKLRADWGGARRLASALVGGTALPVRRQPPGPGQKMRYARWQRLPPWLPSTGRQ